jgi:hypothetical protein
MLNTERPSRPRRPKNIRKETSNTIIISNVVTVKKLLYNLKENKSILRSTQRDVLGVRCIKITDCVA